MHALIAEFAARFTLSATFSILFAGLVYLTVIGVATRCRQFRQWRSYWASGLLCCVFVSALTLLPFSIFNSPVVHEDFSVGRFVSLDDLGIVEGRGIRIEPAPVDVWTWPTILLVVYLSGLAIALARYYFHTRLLSRIIDDCEGLSPDEQQQVDAWLEEASMGDGAALLKPEVRVSAQHVSPFAITQPYPTIVLTRFSLEQLSRSQLKLIVMHESAHIRNRDPEILKLMVVLEAVFWFNPFIHLLGRELKLATELYCDSLVLRRNTGHRRIYSDAFMKIARESIALGTSPLHAANSFFGRYQKRVIMQRILNLKNTEMPAPSRLDKAVLLGLCVVFLGVGSAGEPVFCVNRLFDAARFVPPLENGGVVISPFGHRISEFTGEPVMHSGVDFAAGIGTEVHAVSAGIVDIAETVDEGPYGLNVLITHEGGFKSRYANLDAVLVKEGDSVMRGQLIARVGSSGASVGPHLHFELIDGDVHRDPALYVSFDTSSSKP